MGRRALMTQRAQAAGAIGGYSGRGVCCGFTIRGPPRCLILRWPHHRRSRPAHSAPLAFSPAVLQAAMASPCSPTSATAPC
eukprot:6251440-Prymnesium_polylepis.1